ncbi:hypothetical protein WJM97_20100 [Okeanomitos corallinicola TIOX110]|uniref:Uncharacterized protein n=1 Tax=Okeanomitos corallinicola TIOX110 TaxID=3133117 RepID=A0ABZ2US19_9CYAN
MTQVNNVGVGDVVGGWSVDSVFPLLKIENGLFVIALFISFVVFI